MRYFATTLAIGASLVYTSEAFGISEYYDDWETSVPPCWKDEADGGLCPVGTVMVGDECIGVRIYQCMDFDCPAGEILTPIKYCECVPEEDVLAMFCLPADIIIPVVEDDPSTPVNPPNNEPSGPSEPTPNEPSTPAVTPNEGGAMSVEENNTADGSIPEIFTDNDINRNDIPDILEDASTVVEVPPDPPVVEPPVVPEPPVASISSE